MKTSLPFISFILLLCIAIVGCKKDSTKDLTPQNSLRVDGTEYGISNGLLINYGIDGGAYNIELDLFSSGITVYEYLGFPDSISGNGHGITFNVYSSSGDKLDLVDYALNNSKLAGSFDDGEYTLNWNVALNPDGNFSPLKSGTIKVINSGPEFELSFSGTDHNNKAISGYYKGPLKTYTFQ